jgi:hypothetical protein
VARASNWPEPRDPITASGASDFYTTSMNLTAPNRPSKVWPCPQGRSCVRKPGYWGSSWCGQPGTRRVHARGSAHSSLAATARRFLSSTLGGASPDSPRRMPACAGTEGESDHRAANFYRSGIEEPL